MGHSVISNRPMGFVRDTLDPFLFCVHHLDVYPEGNDLQGPNEPLIGRHIGSDFDESNDWKMYHGRTFPVSPLIRIAGLRPSRWCSMDWWTTSILEDQPDGTASVMCSG